MFCVFLIDFDLPVVLDEVVCEGRPKFDILDWHWSVTWVDQDDSVAHARDHVLVTNYWTETQEQGWCNILQDIFPPSPDHPLPHPHPSSMVSWLYFVHFLTSPAPFPFVSWPSCLRWDPYWQWRVFYTRFGLVTQKMTRYNCTCQSSEVIWVIPSFAR